MSTDEPTTQDTTDTRRAAIHTLDRLVASRALDDTTGARGTVGTPGMRATPS